MERGAQRRGFVFYPTTSTFWPFLLAKVIWRRIKTVIGGGLKAILNMFKGKKPRIGSPS